MVDFKTFYISLAKAFLALFIVLSPILYFNILEDPYGVIFGNYGDSKLEPNKRYLKSNHVLNNPKRYDSFIFGSSRVNALDPTKIIGNKYYNMTYSSGVPSAHYQDICNMLSHGLEIENLLIGLDFEGLLYVNRLRVNDLLRKKPPSNFLDKIKFFTSYIAYMPSWNYVNLYYTKASPSIDRTMVFESGITYNSYFDSLSLESKIFHHSAKRFMIPSSAENLPTQIELAINEIKNIVDIAKENNIKLQFYINPIHAKTILYLNLDAYFEALKELSKFTEFVDFSYLNSITTNNLFYFETSHFNQKVGDLVIARVFNQAHPELPSDFGRYVDSNNIDQHIEFHKDQIAKYFQYIEIDGYQSPNQSFSLMPNKSKDLHWIIDTINYLSFTKVQESYLLSTPVLNLKGRVGFESITENELFIKVGERYFEVNDVSISNNDTLNINWEISIKANQLPKGEQFLELALKPEEGKPIIVTEDSVPIYVIPPHIGLSDLRKDSMDESRIFHIDQINGQSSYYKIDPRVTPFLRISGWVINKTGENPMSNIFVSIAGKNYPLQFIHRRKGLVEKKKDNSLLLAGWSVKIPCSDFALGKYDLDFKVVNNDRRSYWVPQKKYSVEHTKAFSKETLADYVKSPLSTPLVIDDFNGLGTQEMSKVIMIDKKDIIIRGWAIDEPLASNELELIVKIGEKYFTSNYGTPRPDVADALNNQAYVNSGWNINISTQDLDTGLHEVSFILLSKDEKVFYNNGRPITVNIRK